MSNIVFNYPLDLSAERAGNKVVNEEYSIGLLRNRIFVPRGGPFFGNLTTLIDLETNRTLIPVEDYNLLHAYEEAQDRVNQPVYAVVQITNPDVSTRIGLTTHHVGGEFSYSNAALKEAIIQLEQDDRKVVFGDLVGTPSEWNPAPHLHDIRNSYNWKSLIDAVMDVEDAILTGDNAAHSLLIDTLRNKMEYIDQTLINYKNDYNAYKVLVNNELDLMPGVMDDKIEKFKNSLPEVRKPNTVSTTTAVYQIPKKNITYILQPKVTSHPTIEYTIRIPSTLLLEHGDYIELRPARDVVNLTIESIVGPIRRSSLGVIEAVSTYKMRLDKTGVMLVWDGRTNAWDLATALDPERVKFDKYDLLEIETTGKLDFSKANTFLLKAGNARQISFANLPDNRNISAVINVVGDGTVMWPNIRWAGGATPSLSDTNTLVTLYRTNGVWTGNWQNV